jgi:DNA-binding NtrC family response regulator
MFVSIMKYILTFIFVLLCCSDLLACGDKFLVVGRGIRYERAYAAVHPANILIFTKDHNSGKTLQDSLKRAGHKVQAVPDQTKLQSSMNSRKYDLVLIDIADAALLEAKIESSQSNPTVLPIVYKKSGSESTTAVKDYPCILKAAEKNQKVLRAIDQAMASRLKGTSLKCD